MSKVSYQNDKNKAIQIKTSKGNGENAKRKSSLLKELKENDQYSNGAWSTF